MSYNFNENPFSSTIRYAPLNMMSSQSQYNIQTCVSPRLLDSQKQYPGQLNVNNVKSKNSYQNQLKNQVQMMHTFRKQIDNSYKKVNQNQTNWDSARNVKKYQKPELNINAGISRNYLQKQLKSQSSLYNGYLESTRIVKASPQKTQRIKSIHLEKEIKNLDKAKKYGSTTQLLEYKENIPSNVNVNIPNNFKENSYNGNINYNVKFKNDNTKKEDKNAVANEYYTNIQQNNYYIIQNPTMHPQNINTPKSNTNGHQISQILNYQTPQNISSNQNSGYFFKSKKIKNPLNLYYKTAIKHSFNSKNVNYDHIRLHVVQNVDFAKLIVSMKFTIKNKLNEQAKIQLPRTNFRKLLVLDLDETLIHANFKSEVQSQLNMTIKSPNGGDQCIGVNIRPYVFEFLAELSRYYQIIVFTASHQDYANTILDYLDPNHQYISHRLYRCSCIQTQENLMVKNLDIFNRNLKDVVIVDNYITSFAFHQQNGIPILPYFQDSQDQELLLLIDFLKKLSLEDDVRPSLKEYFKLDKYVQATDAQSIVSLY